MILNDLIGDQGGVPQCIRTTWGLADAKAVCRLLMFGQDESHVRAFVTQATTSVMSELL